MNTDEQNKNGIRSYKLSFFFRVHSRAFLSLLSSFALAAMLAGLLIWKTSNDILPLPETFPPEGSELGRIEIRDRNGIPLSVTYQNRWNEHDRVPLYQVPLLLQEAFVESEDQRFYQRRGADWSARFHAMIQNVLAFRIVRGASTIAEQVVRMLHPRPRTLWSRWLEGIEADRLEERFSKAEVLEFYLNQVPYAHQRRGVVQAARMYFDRDLETLTIREMLALAVLVRAPAALDLWRKPEAMRRPIERLAERLRSRQFITDAQYRNVLRSDLSLNAYCLPVEASHFVQHLRRTILAGKREGAHSRIGSGDSSMDALRVDMGSALQKSAAERGRLTSTLDASLQAKVQQILDCRLKDLCAGDALDGAVLVVDHKADEILAWVNGGGLSDETTGGWIDAVTTPRQPGSTLKPFLYALALEMGWTPATLIDDSPLGESIASGLHSIHNYSHTCYGPLRMRDALGNSLNIPAVRTIHFTGADRFLARLHDLGFYSLTQSADYYGNGLALGDGEVSLFELVRAYSVLARHGEYRSMGMILKAPPSISVGSPSGHFEHGATSVQPDSFRGGHASEWSPHAISPPTNTRVGTTGEVRRRIFGEDIASQISDILSDPQARRLEFGDSNLLRFPFQTAVKTGTSSDHRDAWAIGFSNRYTVGVWMGNLDRRPTNGLTGTTGPGLVLRGVFAELNKYEEPQPLYLSPRLRRVTICSISGLRAGPHCPSMQEKFRPENIPLRLCPLHLEPPSGHPASTELLPEDDMDHLRLIQPTPGLQLAMDPRVPEDLQAFALSVSRRIKTAKVEWKVDGKVVGVTEADEYRLLWPLRRGSHVAQARVWCDGRTEPVDTLRVSFTVR